MTIEAMSIDRQQTTRDGWMRRGPFGEQSGGVGMQRDVAVVVEFADGDPQPGCAVELDDSVRFEFAEFTDAHPCA